HTRPPSPLRQQKSSGAPAEHSTVEVLQRSVVDQRRDAPDHLQARHDPGAERPSPPDRRPRPKVFEGEVPPIDGSKFLSQRVYARDGAPP
ncbi:hypothetical protein FOCC_FOCC011722, partial [Frankliniella occidentalis]